MGYLRKLAVGDSMYMGTSGTFFKSGIPIHPLKLLCCWLSCCYKSSCFNCFSWNIPRGLIEDAIYYIMNNHGLISCFCAEKDHPYSRVERTFSLLALGSVTYFGVSVASSWGFSGSESYAWNILFMGFLNFLFTNAFQILFVCSCLLRKDDKNETTVRYVIRSFFDTAGSMIGIILAIVVSFVFLYIASYDCGDQGAQIFNFAVQTHIVGTALDMSSIFIQYIPFVIHFNRVPILGKITLCGSWFREKYLDDLLVAKIEASATESGSLNRSDFRYIQIDFKKIWCCNCICCWSISTELVLEEEKDVSAAVNFVTNAAERVGNMLQKSTGSPTAAGHKVNEVAEMADEMKQTESGETNAV